MQGLLKAADEIARIESDVNKKQGVVAKIKVLADKYKDLYLYQSGGQGAPELNLLACSPTVNSIAKDVDFTEDISTGSVFAWPCHILESGRVYSVPPYYKIGTANKKGFGIVPTANIERTLEMDNLGISAILKVRNYLETKPPLNYLD